MNETRPRIAFFMPSLRGGGVERTFVNLSNELARQGYSIDLVVGTSEGANRELVSPAVNLIDLERYHMSSALSSLVKYLKQRRPLNLVSAMEHTGVASILAVKFSGAKTNAIVSIHHTMSAQYSVAKTWRSQITLRAARLLYPFASRILAVSKESAADAASMLRMKPDRIEVIYNPTVTEQVLDKAKELPDHPWLKEHSEPVIVSVGRLNVHKDFATLIRAFALLRSRRKCRLIILGEGEQRTELEALAQDLGVSDCLSMPGFNQNPYSYMASADVFAMSSISEGLPGALIEALACGVPIVSTDCKSGPKEILEDGKWGILVSVGDVEALANGIETQLDAGKSERHAECYRPFTMEAVCDEYLRITSNG